MKKIKLTLILIGLLCLGNLEKGKAQICEVEFISAKELKTGFMLEWKFPEDILANKFILERSVREIGFKRLETFSDFEDTLTDESKFSFYDNQLGLEKAKYRLKFINEDQSVFYSQEISLSKKVVSTFRIADQTLMKQGVLKVTVECMDERDLEFVMIDESGKEVMHEDWQVELGLNDFFINLDYFKDGSFKAFIRKNREYQTLTFNKTTKKNNQVAMKNKKKN